MSKKQLDAWESVFHKNLQESGLPYFANVRDFKRYCASCGMDWEGNVI